MLLHQTLLIPMQLHQMLLLQMLLHLTLLIPMQQLPMLHPLITLLIILILIIHHVLSITSSIRPPIFVKSYLLLSQILLVPTEFFCLIKLLYLQILQNRWLAHKPFLSLMVLSALNVIFHKTYLTSHPNLVHHVLIFTNSIPHLTNARRNLQLFRTPHLFKEY